MWNQGWRDKTWSRLTSEPFDILIIGGGITGAGILRLATSSGLRAALVEQYDFASGTSSRSSKLVHGGLRYLLQGQIRLLRESITERAWLYNQLPGLVEPLGFLFAIYDGEPLGRWGTGAGLFLHDIFAGTRQTKYLSRDDLLMQVPHLRRPGLTGGFRLIEARTDDARLVIRLLREASADGAPVLNYARAERLIRSSGQVLGVHLRDSVGNRFADIKAQVVINATGAWADALRQQVAAKPIIRPLRGSHLIFPHERLPLYQEVAVRHPVDHRFVFAYPWIGCTLVGTTDLDHDRALSEEPSITIEEVTYLLEALRHFFPAQNLSVNDVTSTFAGVRPVVGFGAGGNPSRMSREHILLEEEGLLTVTGGKLSTFRVTAQHVIEYLKPRIPRELRKIASRAMFTSLHRATGKPLPIDQTTLTRLIGHFGSETDAMLDSAQEGELLPVPGLQTIWAELRWAARNEGVAHLDDLLLRRVRIGNVVPNGAQAHFPRVREICVQELGWDDERWNSEVARYRDIYLRYYSTPTP